MKFAYCYIKTTFNNMVQKSFEIHYPGVPVIGEHRYNHRLNDPSIPPLMKQGLFSGEIVRDLLIFLPNIS